MPMVSKYADTRKTKLVVIVGPTSVGKTAVSQILMNFLDGEIISADSMQVYRGMDIGTAKPSSAERKKYRYHLIDVVDPSENFSAAEYQKLARQAIRAVVAQQKMPLLVGGSGLYVRAAIDPLEFPPGYLDSPGRERLERELEEKGQAYLYEKLQTIDPEAAQKIHPRNVRRIIRALEAMQDKDLKFSQLQKNWASWESIYNIQSFGLTVCRKRLYREIEQRVDQMLANGLLEEVKALLAAKKLERSTAAQALGYKEIIAHLKGEFTLEQAVDLIKQRTRRYAKRQLTWFRRDPRIRWISLDEKTYFQAAEEIVKLLQFAGFI